MISYRTFRHLAVVATVALTGCAITKIDVDVYKGPLANHEEVQLEQMAVMAIGARPILMRLRDRLDGNKRDDKKKLRDVSGNHYQTCIQEPEDTEDQKSKSDDARRVNAILCLYEDRTRQLGNLQTRASNAWREYDRAWTNFQGDNERRNKLKRAMESLSAQESTLMSICSDKVRCQKGLNDLVKAYTQLLTPGGPKPGVAGSVRVAHKTINEGLKKDDKKIRPLLKRYIRCEGANCNYRFLSYKPLVEANARWLFENEDAQNEFVRTVILIAKSFRTARSALRDVLQINLNMLIAFGRDAGSDSAEELSRKTTISQSISHLIGRAHFRAIVKSVDTKKENFSPGLQDLATRAKQDPRVLTTNTEDLPAFKAFLFSELLRNPFETAVALWKADLQFPSPSLPTEGYKDKDAGLGHFKNPSQRKFGLARVVRTDAEFIQDLEQVGENVGPAVTGLAGGRLNDGLERMIDDYLNQDDVSKRHGGRDASTENHRLRDALVRFAQKILFVANYDILLSRDDQKRSNDPRIREYTQVLQAVGNSILNQADELQARETHRNSLKEGAGRARYSASRLLARTPQQTIEAVLDEFAAEEASPSKELQAVKVEVKNTSTELRGVAKRLNPYVKQNLEPADENSPWPEPSELTDKADSPLQNKVSVAEKNLCDAFTARVIEVISARLTLTSRNDQELYEDIRSHKPRIQCNSSFVEAQKLLESRDQTQALAPEMQTHAKRVEIDIANWKPKDKDGNDLQQNGAAIRTKIIDFLKQLQKEFRDQDKDPDYIRLEKVIAYLPTLELDAIPQGKPLDVFDQVRNNLIGADWKWAAAKLSNGFMGLRRARTAMQNEQEVLKELKASYREKHETWTRANKQLKTLTARIEALKTTTAAINSLKATVVAKTLSANLPVDPSATFLLLKTTVAEKLAMAETKKIKTSQAAEGESVAKWRTVWNELDRMNPPTSAETIGQSGLEKDETSQKVLDRLISVLEYEHIEVIKQGSTDGRVKNVAAALRAAFETRGRLAFIRPASSYLRSSYPTASLQNDPGLTWRNELKRHSLKSVPVFGGMITRWLDPRDNDAKVVSQIDRQFWQNINSIRVGGAGRTNYVIVQDDIGNWYVKGYSADPEDIIKSVNALGQFVLSAELDTDLVNRPEPGTGSTPAHQPTALEAVFDKHTAEYERATEETINDVKTNLESLPSDLEAAWKADSRTETVRERAVAQSTLARVHLTEALTELNKDDSSNPEQVSRRPARIVMALRAMDRYRSRLEAGIWKNIPETAEGEENEDKNGTKGESTAAINAVFAIMNEVVGAKIENFLKRREYAAKAYENAIVFVGETTGEASAPSAETSEP